MKLKIKNLPLFISLPAIGLFFLLLLIDWFPLMGTLFTQPSSFEKTDGLISQSEMFRSSGGGSKYQARYNICLEKIVYTYSVDHRNYHSDKINFVSSDALSCSEKQAHVERYYEDKTVNVFYLPCCPLISVLEPQNKLEIPSYLISRFVIPYTFIVICSLLVFGGIIKDTFRRKTNGHLKQKKNGKSGLI